MNIVKEISRINELELSRNLVGESSWHDEYKDSSYIFFGGVSIDLTEGDIITIFSQYGEIVNIDLIRDLHTGKSKGFGFLAYEDQRSTILAVDNLNHTKVLDRTIRVDHVKDYKNKRRERDDFDEEKERLRLKNIIPKRLQPKDWSPEEESKEEEDPMKNYLHSKSKKKHHHHKRHRERPLSKHHHKRRSRGTHAT